MQPHPAAHPASAQPPNASAQGLDASPSLNTASGARGGRFPLRLFCQELAVLLAAGIPLLEALTTLREKEQQGSVACALQGVIDALQEGHPFSIALAQQPQAFTALFVSVVQSAERTGQTEQALREHASYLGWVESLRKQLIGAAIYPTTLIVAGAAVILFLLVFVVPRFAGILDTLGGDMPAASRLLISVGLWTGENALLTVLIGVAVLVAPVLAWRAGPLRGWVMGRLETMPLLGDKLRLLALAQLYRTASMLLGAGVPVVPALQTARAVAAVRLQPLLDAAIDHIKTGERFSVAFETQGLSTPVALRMMRVGERTGELGPMLGQAAAFYDEELARLTELVTKLINPLLMLIMGGVIGAVIVLMYLPIFQLVEQVQ